MKKTLLGDPQSDMRLSKTTNTFLVVPDEINELRMDLSRERLINVVGYNRRGERVVRHLKVTRRGMALM